MRLLAAINQALFSARSRGSNGGAEATKVIRSDQLRLQKVNISYNDLQYHPQTLDPSNVPDTCESDPVAFIDVHPELKPRQAEDSTTFVSTCGYLNGNASLPRTANPGFDCRVDTKNAIWGFCPTTISIVSDCGLAGGCMDAHACATGCGISDDPNVTTFTCTNSGADYCSIALLTDGPDQTYSYIACKDAAITDHLLYSPTITPLLSSTSSTTLSRAKASVTSASSTSSAISSTPISTPPITSVITSAPASSSTLSIASPSPSKNTGAIVGGVLGGSALLAFVVVAIFLSQRRRKKPTNVALNDDSVWQDTESRTAMLKKAPSQTLHLAELSSDKAPAELSSGRRDETTELPNNMEETGRS